MSKFGFGALGKQIQQRMEASIPGCLDIAQQKFEEAFAKQGWDGNDWEEVQRRIAGTQAYRRGTLSDRSRPILIGRTGTLSQTVSHPIRVFSRTWGQLRMPVPYAEYHNIGTDRIPQRTFVDQTDDITVAQRAHIINMIG